MASIYGYEVESTLPLRRLRKQPGPRGKIGIAEGPPTLLDRVGDLLAYREDEGETFAVASAGAIHLVACSATGAYELDARRRRVRVAATATQGMWEHRLLSVVLPMMLSADGELMLHAAAVRLGPGALLLCGPARRGKSTLALTLARLGYPVLSEDGSAVERVDGSWVVWPGAAGVRIRGTRGREPEVVSSRGPEPDGAAPVIAVALLTPRQARLGIERLAPARALAAISGHLIHPGGRAAAAVAFGAAADLLGQIPAFELTMPDGLAGLPAAAAELAGRAESGALATAPDAGYIPASAIDPGRTR